MVQPRLILIVMRKSTRPKFLKRGALLYIVIAVMLLLILLSNFESKKLLVVMLLPFLLLAMNFMDAAASEDQPDLIQDPLIGQEVIVLESFTTISDCYEGRVLLNGATWNARSSHQKLEAGDVASVTARHGQMLEL